MDRILLSEAVKNGRIEWKRHSLERMMEREITRDEVKKVLLEGELIIEYTNDTPFPSGLFLDWVKGEPLHVVASFDYESKWCFIITAYRPDLEHFESDYKTKRK